MNRKLSCILLVDDDRPTNFLHRLLLEEMDCAERIVEATNGVEAIDYLTSTDRTLDDTPEVILLDINMPVMNGWEFLEEYKKLDPSLQKGLVVIMLTTSLNPDDRSGAESNELIKKFLTKPLTKDSMNQILEEFFARG